MRDITLRYNQTGPDQWNVSIHDGEDYINHTVAHMKDGFYISGFTRVFPSLRRACKFLLTGDGQNHRATPLTFGDPIPVDVSTAVNLVMSGYGLSGYMDGRNPLASE